MSTLRHLVRSQATLNRCITAGCSGRQLSSSTPTLLEKNKVVPTPLPRASNPESFRPRNEGFNPVPSSKTSAKKRKTFRSRSGNKASPARAETSPLQPVSQQVREGDGMENQSVNPPSTAWIHIRDTPPLATLDDIVNSVDQVLNIERKIGILDLDLMDGTMVEPSTPWVKRAKVVLSTHGRPTSWRVQFENRSVAHAFLEHTKESNFICVWKPVRTAEWIPDDSVTHQIDVNDSMIRVEECPERMSLDHVRHLFRRYDLTREGNSVTSWTTETSSKHSMFLVRFADASFARAAVREMQGVRVKDKPVKLAQYPKQL